VGLSNACASLCVAGSAIIDHHTPYWEQPFSQPYFDNSTRRDTSTAVGQTAYLHCRVRNLGDRAVSKSSSAFLSMRISPTLITSCTPTLPIAAPATQFPALEEKTNRFCMRRDNNERFANSWRQNKLLSSFLVYRHTVEFSGIFQKLILPREELENCSYNAA